MAHRPSAAGAQGLLESIIAASPNPGGAADLDGDPVEFGRVIHRATELVYQVTNAIQSHSGLALAEAYRREGPFAFVRLRPR